MMQRQTSDTAYTPMETTERAAAATMTVGGHRFFKMNISLKTPVLAVPTSLRSSSYLVAHLGNMKLYNADDGIGVRPVPPKY